MTGKGTEKKEKNRRRKYWISCCKFTVLVETSPGGKEAESEIVWSAPMTSTFVGEPLINLLRWAKRFGGLQVKRL
jgi:hypothetical protein